MVARQRVLNGAAVLLAIGFLVAFTTVMVRSQRLFLQFVPELAWPSVAVSEAFVVAGLVLMWDRQQRMNGVLWLVFGVCYWGIWLALEYESTWVAVILVLSWTVSWLLPAVVLLRYPDQRLARRYERRFLLAAAVWLTAWAIVDIITKPPDYATPEQVAQWPLLLPDHDLNAAAMWALELGNLVFGVGVVLLLALRIIRTRGLDRRTYAPFYVASAAVVVVVLIRLVVGLVVGTGRASESFSGTVLAQVEMAAAILAALSLLYGTVQRSLARVRVADLVVDVNAARTPEEVQAALRQTMADPSLEVLFWAPDISGYVDAEGRLSSVPEPEDKRLAMPVTDRHGDPLALVLADPAAAHHRDLVAAALAASALGLENAALHANLLARLVEIRESRARVVAAGDAERRRLERDLHDGAQQHLVGIALKLRLARDSMADSPADAAALLDGLTSDVHDAAEELRALAHGIYPPLLASAGLRDALNAAAARAGLPTEVDVAGGERYPPEIEAAVYFCCLEALQNAGKHAGPGACAMVRVWEDEGTLRFEVADDGAGLDPDGTGQHTGHGFVNMGDRLGAIGGLLEVRPGPDRGACVNGVIPLRDSDHPRADGPGSRR